MKKTFTKKTNLENEKKELEQTLDLLFNDTSVSPIDILGKNNNGEITRKRYYTWLFFHTELEYSNKLLSVLFNRTTRGIIKGIKCISLHIELYNDYEVGYNHFKKEALNKIK